jgi:hypothetical protein
MTINVSIDSRGNCQVRPVCSGCGKVMDCSLFSDCEGDNDHVALLDPDLLPDTAAYVHYHRACVPKTW